mgnify:FL=1
MQQYSFFTLSKEQIEEQWEKIINDEEGRIKFINVINSLNSPQCERIREKTSIINMYFELGKLIRKSNET